MKKKREKIDIKSAEQKLEKNLEELRQCFRSFRRFTRNWVFEVQPLPLGRYAGVKREKNRDGKWKNNIVVYLTPQALKECSNAEIKGFLIHEILHIYNKHFEREEKNIKDVSVAIPEIGVYPSLWNVATDLAINYIIQHHFKTSTSNSKCKIKLHKNSLTTSLFPQHIREKIEDKDAEYIFDVLKKEYEKDTEKFKKMLKDIIKQMIKNGFNPSGTGSGKGEKDDENNNEEGIPVPVNINFDDHSEVMDIELTPEEQRKIEKEMEKKSNTFGNSYGDRDGEEENGNEMNGGWAHNTNPDPLKYSINKFYVKYKRHLKTKKILKSIRSTLTSHSSSLIPTIRYNYKRVNRKKDYFRRKYGTIYKGKNKIFKANDLIVAIDTSGSVSNIEIKMALEIIRGFIEDWKVNIYLIQADDYVRDVQYITKSFTDIDIKGRGCTNYQPVFDYVKKNFIDKGENPRQILLVYIGDGETSYEIENYGINTLWLFVPTYDEEFYDNIFGQKYIIPFNSENFDN